jgi:U3 small nucleolar ribonucleoprotein protein LCP5
MTSDQSLELLTCIATSNSTVTASLHRSIQQYTQNKEYNAKTDGLDYLQVKNGIMISYLIDLTMLLRCKLNSGDDESKVVGEQCIKRLQEMKVALEKMRPLEKRMRYQIDKLLALSTLGAGTFAAVGQEEEEKDVSGDEEREEGGELDENDPLSFKPDLQGMMSMFQDDDEKVRFSCVMWLRV